jgi:predicted dehydrogenase
MTTTPHPAAISTKPRLGFAGLGWIGRNRMNAVAESGLIDVAFACDPVADLSEFHCDTAKEFESILAADVDAIVIATPSALHAQQAIAALEHGKAVFCQKPLGRNAAETRRVVDAARANNLLLGVDFSYRYTAAMRAVRQTAREIGDIFAANLVFHNAYGPDKPWFYDAQLAGGGCVIDLGIHLVDAALWILDFPRVERVTARLFHHGGHSVEDYATARLDLAGGIAVDLACSWNLSAGRDCAIEATFYGTRGAAAFRNVNGSFYDFIAERYDKTKSTLLAEPPDAWSGRAIVDWADRLAVSSTFDPEVEHIVQVAEALDAIYSFADHRSPFAEEVAR